jgi:hypothetical protein
VRTFRQLTLDAAKRYVETAARVVALPNRFAERQERQLELLVHRAWQNAAGRAVLASLGPRVLAPAESLARPGDASGYDATRLYLDLSEFGQRGFRGDRVLVSLAARALAGDFAALLAGEMFRSAEGEAPQSPVGHFVKRYAAELRRLEVQSRALWYRLAQVRANFNPPRALKQAIP